MNITSFLGSLGTLIGVVRAMPQLARLLRAKKACGVSVDTAATSAVVSFGWTSYGALTGQPFVCLATGSSGLIFVLITLFALRFGRRASEFNVAPIWLVVLIFTGGFVGKTGLGIVLPISVLAANVPQLMVASKEGNLSDLSLGTWSLSITDGLVWGAYAVIQQDLSIMAFAFFQLTTSGMIVCLKLAEMNRNRLKGSVGISKHMS